MNVARAILRMLLGRRMPISEGTLSVASLDGAVTIGRDRYGIPHIAATTSHDAWFGLGFCQGQDRGFQLELQRRAVRGTLAELLGPEGVQVDLLSRRLGLARSAVVIVERLRAADREAVDAFAAGVNAATETGTTRPPHELALLRTGATMCTPADLVGMTLLQAFALASNWDSELARLEILSADGPEALAAVDPVYPEWQPVTSPPGAPAGPAIEALRSDLSEFAGIVTPAGGSNNWALAGARTASGRPIVANDPHLAPVLPPHWYLAHLTTPDWGVAGACIAGTPGFGVGHNGHVAWGVTAGLLDNTDLFLERMGPDGQTVLEGEEFVPCRIREEVIAVRGADPVSIRVRETSRGPIIGESLERTPDAISIGATWLDPRRPGMLATIHSARTVADLHDEMRWWHGPSLNVVYADVQGDIAWTLIGEAPVRRSGHGTIPLPGWLPEVGWFEDYVDYDDLPHEVSPAAGFLATANNRPHRTDEDPFLGVDWIDGHRIARIVELLADDSNWTLEGALAMQLDTVSHAWRDLRTHVLGIGERANSLVSYLLLEMWDGDMRTDASAATVFVAWLAEMEHRLAAALTPRSTGTALGSGHVPAALAPFSGFGLRRTGHLTAVLRNRPEGCFADWDDEIAAALAAAEADIRGRFGNDTDRWAWGTVRPLTLRHPVSERAPLDRIFNLGPFPWSGDFSTISQAGAPPLDPFGDPSAIASLRAAMDVGDWDRSRFSLPGGQSGNPLSPHYSDQLDAWMRGAGVPMPWSGSATRAAVRERLFLIPSES